MWKDDVSGAFPQTRINPKHVWLTATRVDELFIFIHTNGFFGHLNMPMVYGVLSRAFERKGNKIIDGCLKIYVDDFVGLAPKKQQRATKSKYKTQLKRNGSNKTNSTKEYWL